MKMRVVLILLLLIVFSVSAFAEADTTLIKPVINQTEIYYSFNEDSSILLLEVVIYQGCFYKENVLILCRRLEKKMNTFTGTHSEKKETSIFSFIGKTAVTLKKYELANHLGNVGVVISDRKVAVATTPNGNVFDHWKADVLSASDYYPFGMLMPGRNFNLTDYRFGFQGQEKDDEVKGSGNSINYEFRVHDTRLGRFLSTDPIGQNYPHNSPYAFSENRVIDGVELEGLEFSSTGKYWNSLDGKYHVQTTVKISVINSSKVITNTVSIDNFKNAIQKTIEKDFSGGDGTSSNPIVTTEIEYVGNGNGFSYEFKEAEVQTDASGAVTGYVTGRTEKGIGETQTNNLFVSTSINGAQRTVGDIARTAVHELGHAAGLKHPFHGASETDLGGTSGISTYKDNLMNSFGGSRNPNSPEYNPIPSTSGHNVTTQQLNTITNEVLKDVKAVKETKVSTNMFPSGPKISGIKPPK